MRSLVDPWSQGRQPEMSIDMRQRKVKLKDAMFFASSMFWLLKRWNQSYPWRQDNACCDIALALLGVGLIEADHLLHGKYAEGADEPLPKVGRMQNATQPERKVEEVSPVETCIISNTIAGAYWPFRAFYKEMHQNFDQHRNIRIKFDLSTNELSVQAIDKRVCLISPKIRCVKAWIFKKIIHLLTVMD